MIYRNARHYKQRGFSSAHRAQLQEDVGISALSCGQDPGSGIQRDYMFQSQVGLLIQPRCQEENHSFIYNLPEDDQQGLHSSTYKYSHPVDGTDSITQ